jgi:imidazolonepropionase-like amidohydrolase
MSLFKQIFFFVAMLPQSLPAQDFSAEVEDFIVEDGPQLVLENVRVIDGTGVEALEGQDLLVSHGRIAGLGEHGTLTLPAAARRLNFEGYSVLPGYVMLHEHLYYRANDSNHYFVTQQPVAFPRLYLAGGVTTARTGGSLIPVLDLEIRRRIDAGFLVGPNLDVTGPYVIGGYAPDVGVSTFGMQLLESPEDARNWVNFWADKGATSFKSHRHVTRAVLAAAIEATHRRGLKFAGHLCSVTYREAAELGIDNIEHGFLAATDFFENKQPDVCPANDQDRSIPADLSSDDPRVRSLLDLLIEKDVAVTSTLPVFVRGNAALGMPPQGALDALDGPSRAAFLERRARILSRPREDLDVSAARLRAAMRLTKAFHDAGGLLAVGTDPTGIGGTVAGYANFEAIELLVEAGLNPLGAIRVATLNGAIYLERDHEIGSIAVGKKADLVVVKGAPDQNIADVREVEIVFKRGIGFDSKRLFESARGAIGAPGG